MTSNLPLTVCAALLLAALPVAAQNPTSTPPDTVPTAAARVDALFAPWNRAGSPGCTVGVSLNGSTIYEKGFGNRMWNWAAR